MVAQACQRSLSHTYSASEIQSIATYPEDEIEDGEQQLDACQRRVGPLGHRVS